MLLVAVAPSERSDAFHLNSQRLRKTCFRSLSYDPSKAPEEEILCTETYHAARKNPRILETSTLRTPIFSSNPKVRSLPIVSLVVPFLGYLGS